MQKEILKILHTMGLPNRLAAEMTVGLTTMFADEFAARLAEGLAATISDMEPVCDHAGCVCNHCVCLCENCGDCGGG